MAVISAAVEANGWVLAVRGPWSATPGAWNFSGFDRVNGQFLDGGVDQFPLDPSGTPKVTLSVQDAGFDRVGGLPVANANRPRTVVATKAIRRAHPNPSQLDETDHGDGTRTVRLALSDRIYATSTVVSVSFLSGWKAGEGGGVINTVTNSSTRTVPLPIFRWANEPWPYVVGTLGTPNHTARVELVGASHHPEHFGIELHQAFAAVKLTAYDGTTSKDFFFTAPQTSTLYGDSLRCWGGEIDLSGLSPGPITVHATVYPWRGAERSTGNAQDTSIIASLATAWGGPFHLYYDPTGANSPGRKFLCIDNTSTNNTPSNSTHVANVTLYDDVASALAAPLANKAANVMVAIAKLGTQPTWTGRNGFSDRTRSAAYSEMILTAGQTHETGPSVGSTGGSAGVGYIIIRGDPTDSDPRANCIFRANTTSPQQQFGTCDRVKLMDLTCELGTSNIFLQRTNSWVTTERVSFVGRSGQTSGSGRVYDGLNNFSAFNTTFANMASQERGFMMRNVVRTRANDTAATACMIGVRIVSPPPGDFAPSRTVAAFGGGTANTNDCILWNCEAYAWIGDLFTPNAGVYGSGLALERLAVINCLHEGGEVNGRILQIGETTNSQLRDSIFEGVTLVGGRFNFHNDSDLAGTVQSNAFRVNQGTTITVGVMAHGLTTGDTITTSGSSNANLNRTNTAVTVLDANRFTYVAGGSVTTVPGTLPTITVTSGARNGDTLTLRRDNLRQTGNVFRYCSFDRNATKHDTFNNDGNLTGSWELLYGVGFRGNVNANRGTLTPQDFQYAFYGIGSDVEVGFTSNTLTGVPSYGRNWHGYVLDASANGPLLGSATYGGDYRADTIAAAPDKPSRLLNRGRAPAVIDRTGDNSTRLATFDGGARGRVQGAVGPTDLQPADCASGHLATSGRVGWMGRIAAARAVSPMRGSEAVLRLAGGAPAGFGRLLRVDAEASGIRVGRE